MNPQRAMSANSTRTAEAPLPVDSLVVRALLGRFIDASGVAMMILSEDGAVLLSNRAAEELLRRTEAELCAAPLGRFAPSGAHFDARVDPSRRLQVEVSKLKLVDSTVRLVTLFDRSTSREEQSNENATARRSRAREEHLSHLASHDPLTGLLNRRGLTLELAAENRRGRRSGAPLAAILIDCDDFKRVNEALGHSGGDRALRELSRRLAEVLRPSDRLGRIGGDEFLVLLPETRLAEASAVAERLRLAVEQIELGSPSGVLALTVSLGVEAIVDDGSSLDAVVASAESSLSRSKQQGKNRATTLRAPAQSEARALLDRVQAATGLDVVQQAIVRLGDRRVVGAKLELFGCASRFAMPRERSRSTLAADLVEQIDLECLRLCLASAGAHTSDHELHVELLPSTLLRTDPAELAAEFLRVSPGRRWCVELSEQQIVGDPVALLPAATALRSAGVRLALKDMSFARGALEALIVLEPEVVKLDAHVVRLAESSVARKRALTRLTRVVRALASELHAVGVDTSRELELLSAAGVAFGQGSLWRSALPACCAPVEGSGRS